MEIQLIVLTTILVSYSPSSANVMTQNTLATLIKDILSPANTEKAMQIINMAGKRTAIPAKTLPECGMPAFAINLAEYGPTRVPTGNLPVATVIARNDLPVSGIASYITDGVARENVYSVRQMARHANPVKVQTNLIDSLVLPQEIYQVTPAMPQNNAVCSYATPAPVLNPYSPVYSPASSPYSPASSPYSPASSPYLPASNPYLPVASPISMTSAMPPPTQSKGQFLRKIPMPPPTL